MLRAIIDCVKKILDNPHDVEDFVGYPYYTAEKFSCSSEHGIFSLYTVLEIEGVRVSLTGKEEKLLSRALTAAHEYKKISNLLRLEQAL